MIASLVVIISVFWVGAVDGIGFHHHGYLLNWSGIPVSIGLFGFCYSGHAVFPNIYTSLKNQADFDKILGVRWVIHGACSWQATSTHLWVNKFWYKLDLCGFFVQLQKRESLLKFHYDHMTWSSVSRACFLGFGLLQLLAMHIALWWCGSYGLHHVWGGYCITNHPQSSGPVLGLQNCCLDHSMSSALSKYRVLKLAHLNLFHNPVFQLLLLFFFVSCFGDGPSF